MKKADFIAPDAYPQPVSRSDAAKISRALKSSDVLERGARVIQQSSSILRMGVLDYVRELEQAGSNPALVFDKAHEIRGFAETAGLRATGRIADGLCRYLEEAAKRNLTADAAVVALHVSAIVRAAHAKDEASRMSDVVAKELSALAAHKLAEAKTGAAAN
ncbi:MAG TPA: hypothetical protein VGM68_13115 [Rhizomicrobium sp.]|jgi:hypothetical protein